MPHCCLKTYCDNGLPSTVWGKGASSPKRMCAWTFGPGTQLRFSPARCRAGEADQTFIFGTCRTREREKNPGDMGIEGYRISGWISLLGGGGNRGRENWGTTPSRPSTEHGIVSDVAVLTFFQPEILKTTMWKARVEKSSPWNSSDNPNMARRVCHSGYNDAIARDTPLTNPSNTSSHNRLSPSEKTCRSGSPVICHHPSFAQRISKVSRVRCIRHGGVRYFRGKSTTLGQITKQREFEGVAFVGWAVKTMQG